MKPSFNPKRVYNIDLNLTMGEIPKVVINTFLKDGRVTSHIVDKILPHIFKNVQYVNNAGSNHDLTIQDTNGKRHKIESKTLTKSSGLDLTPSSQKGKGRTFDMDEALARAQLVTAYVITDITHAPHIVVWTLGKAQVQDIIRKNRGKLSIAKARGLIPAGAPIVIKL